MTALRYLIAGVIIPMFICFTTICEAHAGDGKTASVKIMPLGDSITQADVNHAGYRYYLWKILKDAGYKADLVGSLSLNNGGPNPMKDFDADHEGHWGWSADQILNGIPGKGKLSEFLKLNTPDVVLMHLGSNDIFRQESIQKIISELREIVRVIRAANPEAVILIARLIPVPDPDIRKRIGLLNDSITKLPEALKSPSKIIVVRQDMDFDPVKDTYDGIHPNMNGEKKMAEKWYEALIPVLQK